VIMGCPRFGTVREWLLSSASSRLARAFSTLRSSAKRKVAKLPRRDPQRSFQWWSGGRGLPFCNVGGWRGVAMCGRLMRMGILEDFLLEMENHHPDCCRAISSAAAGNASAALIQQYQWASYPLPGGACFNN
jgi:hypothetical protein